MTMFLVSPPPMEIRIFRLILDMARFNYNDIVTASPSAPPVFRPGARAWIVGVYENQTDAWLKRFPPGVVYSIEFEDGSSIEVHESMLEKWTD
jgi:hypothetical protein